jgi:phytoene dehydrogenase-like protein
MQRVRGGMGKLSECLAQQIEAMDGEVRSRQRVKRVLVQDKCAIGVELKDGSALFANVIISNLDKPATFNGMLAGDAAVSEAVPAPAERAA